MCTSQNSLSDHRLNCGLLFNVQDFHCHLGSGKVEKWYASNFYPRRHSKRISEIYRIVKAVSRQWVLPNILWKSLVVKRPDKLDQSNEITLGYKIFNLWRLKCDILWATVG